MLRALLALLLIAALGAIGFYFWSQGTAQAGEFRARTEPPAARTEPPARTDQTPPVPGETPRVDTGLGAAPATMPQPAIPGATSLGVLGARRIGLPIAGLRITDLIDTFAQARGNGERQHEATDILAPRGTAVVAVDDGVVKKLFNSVPGGITLYQYDPTEQYCYYYAHLDRYAEGIKEGQQIRRGDLIGYVGTTGNADANTPHLHFAILQLGPSKEWWQNTTPVNPYPILMSAITESRTR